MTGRAPFALACLALSACAGAPAVREGQPTLEQLLGERPRPPWVAAHPDDESLAGAVLAKACLDLELPCHFLGFLRIFGVQDPGRHHEEFDGNRECGRRADGAARSCLEVMAENTHAHRSQETDMDAARRAAKLASAVYLRHVDPFGPEAAVWTGELDAGR